MLNRRKNHFHSWSLSVFLSLTLLQGCKSGVNSIIDLSLQGTLQSEVRPTISLTRFPSAISNANVNSVPLAGNCAVEGGTIRVIAGNATSSTSCTQGAWALSLNLSSLADGSITIEAIHTNPSSGEMLSASTTLLKDTLAPGSPTLVINNSWINTLSTSASLVLSATGASEMYVSSTSGCASGGAWEPYATSKAWTLSSLNANNLVYVKYRDTSLNESGCVSGTIHHGNGTSFADSFSDPTLDLHWMYANLQTLSSGRIVFTPTPNSTVAAQAGLRLDFTEASIAVEVPQVLNTGANTETLLYLMDESFNAVYTYVSNSNINFVRGTAYNATTIPYNTVTHRFWRIRFTSPDIFWETSPDGVGWTVQKTVAASTAITSTSGYLYLIGKTTSPVATPGSAQFDNLLITK